MRVLIADKFESVGVEGLKELGAEVEVAPDLDGPALRERVESYRPQILIVRSTKVPAAVVEAGASHGLKAIIRAGSGYDNIDADRASELGVAVCNTPGMNAVAVAELAMGHIINCDRRIPAQTAELLGGRWNKKEYSKARGLKGSVLGLIGFGQIAREVAQRARAFDMKVQVWTRRPQPEIHEAYGCESVGHDRQALLRLAATSDVVSVHVALTDETRGMLDDAFFAAMKDGATFVNTSRGEVADEAALLRRAEEKGLRLGLDVFSGQPSFKDGEWRTPAAGARAASLSHHVGASTDQAQTAVAEEVVRIVANYRDTGELIHVVNAVATA